MTLLAHHDNALFACVSAILEAEAAALNRHDEVLQTVAAIFRVAQRAIASFAEHWNAAKAATLPVELLVNCFQHLRFSDRLLVSHVSQHWRRVALNTPLLWTDLSAWKANGKLEEMLRRSAPAPLSLRLYLTAAEEAALRPHFARIRELRCVNPPKTLDAPLLETLVIGGPYSGELVLSQAYVGSSAQSLRTLHLRAFSIHPPSAAFPHNLRTLQRAFSSAPHSAAFPNLREFKAKFTKHTRLQDLLALCPSLESLTAWCDVELGKDPKALFVPLPSRLAEVTITGLLTDPTHDVLKPWLTHRFRRLEMGKLVGISSTLNFFCASLPSPESPWSLDIRTEEHMSYVLSTDTDDSTHLVGPKFAPAAAAAALASIQRFRPHIAHLTDLRLSIQFLHIAVDMALELPAVTALAFVVVPEHDGKAPYASFETAATGGMVVPLLRSLAFACHPSYAFGRPALEWFFHTLAYRLRDWVRYDAKTLDAISLEGKASKSALKKVEYKHSFIYSLAQEIRIDASAAAD